MDYFAGWNAMPKYVVSSTVTDPQWNNTTVLSSLDDVAALKETEGGPIFVQGSMLLTQGLLKAGLVDEMRLMVFPVILGSGRGPFPDDAEDKVKLDAGRVHDVRQRRAVPGAPHATLSQRRRRRRFERMESYAKGELEPPLLEETIGANFDAHRRGARRPRGAGRVRDRPALDLGRARPRRRRARPRPDRAPGSRRATGSASGRRTAPSGRSRSTPPRRSASSWSTSTRRTAPTSSPTPSTSPGMRLLVAATRFKTSEYRADGRGDRAASARRCERAVYLDTDDWAELVAERRAAARRRAGRADGDAVAGATRSTSSTRRAPPAAPRARRSATATSSTTATSRPS